MTLLTAFTLGAAFGALSACGLIWFVWWLLVEPLEEPQPVHYDGLA